MCFPTRVTHIPSDMCSTTWEKHIPCDMTLCSPTRETFHSFVSSFVRAVTQISCCWVWAISRWEFNSYCETQKTVNTRNIFGMFLCCEK